MERVQHKYQSFRFLMGFVVANLNVKETNFHYTRYFSHTLELTNIKKEINLVGIFKE